MKLINFFHFAENFWCSGVVKVTRTVHFVLYLKKTVFTQRAMPKVKTKQVRFPEGWEILEPYIEELEKEMRTGSSV